MTTQDPRHTPTADFVSALEREVLRAYRSEVATTVSPLQPRTRWREHWRVAAALIIGLGLGVGSQLALLRVRDDLGCSHVASRALGGEGGAPHPRARKSGFFEWFEAKKQAINAREEHASADTTI